MTDAYSVRQILDNRIAQTPPLADSSKRIPTTEWVSQGLTIQPTSTVMSRVVSFAGSAIGKVANLILTSNENLAIDQEYDLAVLHSFGGTNIVGGRITILGWVELTAATSTSNVNKNYIGVVGIGEADSGDGGTNLGAGAAGAIFGANLQTRMGTSAQNILNVAGLEIDDYGENGGGQSVKYKWPLSLVSFNPARGASVDAALVIYTGGTSGVFGPGTGFGSGLIFAEIATSGFAPVSATATLIGTHLESLANFTASNGVDLRNFRFSGLAWASRNLLVADTANVGAGFGFGENMSLGGFAVIGNAAAPQGIFGDTGAGDVVMGAVSNHAVEIRTNNAVALTLDTGKNASFKASLATAPPTTQATTTYSMAIGDSSIIFNINATATLTLQSATTYSGRWLSLKTTSSAVVSGASNVVPLAGGAAGTSILAATPGKWAMLQSDGSNWQIMASN